MSIPSRRRRRRRRRRRDGRALARRAPGVVGRRSRAARRELAALDGDPHGLDGVATKQHRAKKFAEWLVATFGEEALRRGRGALDVAGGRGDVAFELHTVRGVPTTLVEPRARKLNRAQHKWMKRRARGAVLGGGRPGGGGGEDRGDFRRFRR